MASCNFLVIFLDAGLCLPLFTRHDAKNSPTYLKKTVLKGPNFKSVIQLSHFQITKLIMPLGLW